MDRRKLLLTVLAAVALMVSVRALWPYLAHFDATAGVAGLGRSPIDMETPSPSLAELRLADLELKAAEYHPGRDPFRFEAAPPPPPPPPKPVPKPAQTQRRPPPRPKAGGAKAAPQPPPVDVKYLGSFGPENAKIAVFGDGNDLYNVRKGGILKEHFVVESINYESADLKFVNFPQLPATRLAAGE
ncbi:MAG: hypothetical protein ACE5GX_07120 [Thermoanaerobaculia bacterium]